MPAVRTFPVKMPELSRLPSLVLVAAIHVAMAWLLLLPPARAVMQAASVTMASLIREPSGPAARPHPVPFKTHLTPLSLDMPPMPTIVLAAGEPTASMQTDTSTTRGEQVAANPTADSRIEPPQFDLAYLKNPPPAYPLLSKRLREQGRVLLRVRVSVDGLAEQIEIQASSGAGRLDAAAIEAVRQWRFVPARRGADAVSAWALVPVSFQLT